MSEKEKIDVTADEVSDLFPHYVSPQGRDEVLTTTRMQGLDVLERDAQLPWSTLEQRPAREVDEVELDVTPPGPPQAASDPVRVFLREMGASPLLTREGEVALAKRIERGQLSTLKAFSRSPIVICQVLAIGQDLKDGVRSIRDIVVADEEEIIDEILRQDVQNTTRRIDMLDKHYKRACRLTLRLTNMPSTKKPREYRHCRCQLRREAVRMSIIIRNLRLSHAERKRLTERVNKTIELMRPLDRELSNLEKKIASTRSDELKRYYRTTQRQYRDDMKNLESHAGTSFRSCAGHNAKSSKVI